MAADPFGGRYAGRRVLVTGHTGFLGGWTVRWLARLGAEVAGYSRGQRSGPPGPALTSFDGDVADAGRLAGVLARFAPEIVLHLAGQTIVAAACRAPAATFRGNVLGTVGVLDAALHQPSVRSVVVAGSPATAPLTDGLELSPYPASKLAAEAAVACYAHPRTQQAAGRAAPLAIAVARPGVMLGGDWAEGRLLADVARAVGRGQPVTLNAPGAVRPWQHVLDGISGMLTLADRLIGGPLPSRRYDLGCLEQGAGAAVRDVVGGFLAAYGVPDWPVRITGDGPADRLDLGYQAAAADMGWRPAWALPDALDASARWYRAAAAGPAELDTAIDDVISAYSAAACSAWAAA